MGNRISWNELDEITRKHTAFSSFHCLLIAEGGYRPSICVSNPELLVLADQYDLAQERCGDSRRAYRLR